MTLIGTLIGVLIRALSFIGTLCILLMMLHVTADVVMRYVFNAPLPGTLNIVSRYYMVIIVFLSLGAVEKQGAQISVEIVYELLPGWLQKTLVPLSFALTAAVFGLLTLRTTQAAVEKTRLGATVEQGTTLIPIWQSYWPVAIGCGVITVYAGYRLLLSLTGGHEPRAVTSTSENFHE